MRKSSRRWQNPRDSFKHEKTPLTVVNGVSHFLQDSRTAYFRLFTRRVRLDFVFAALFLWMMPLAAS